MADANTDGIITAEELSLFLRNRVTKDSENQQTPQSGRFTSHEGEFVFIGNADKIIIPNNEVVNASESNIDYDILAKKIAKELSMQQKTEEQPSQAGSNKVYDIEIGDSFTLGPDDAKVTIIEWADFQ